MVVVGSQACSTWAPKRLPWNWSPPPIDGLTPQGEAAAACRFLYEAGYHDHFHGHITWKQPDGTFLTNAYEVNWDHITAADILSVDEDGAKVDEHPLNPSTGLNLHASLHHFMDGARTECIIHAHSEYGRYWAVRGEAPPIYDFDSAQLGDDVHVTTNPTELWLREHDA